MARRTTKQTGPTPVDSITHGDKRTNIPTADAHAFVDPAIEEVRKVRYARDESLDPQLVWRGKYPPADEISETDLDLVTDVPPIYIQEKIDPRVLIENLRRTAERSEDEPELKLFESFDGLGGLDQVDFYKHDANWSNRMILGDSLQVMASLAEREKLRGKVQMVYIDPPYGISFGSNWQGTTSRTEVKDGRIDDLTREAEQIRAFRDTWELGIHSYLSYLRDRLAVARDLMTESGSCLLQISDENVHLVRSLMDEVFGRENFIALIPFRKKTMPFGTLFIEQMDDFIIWYAKTRTDSRGRMVAKYRKLFRSDPSTVGYSNVELSDGRRMSVNAAVDAFGEVPADARYWTSKSLEPSGPMESGRFKPYFEGREYEHPKNGYATDETGMKRLMAAGRIVPSGSLLRYVLYADDKPFGDLTAPWQDTVGADGKRYVVQTNSKVIERCVLMCTDPGDLVIDPTCGSGTTAYVAEKLGRRWITVDTSRVALTLARQRLMWACFPWYLLADSEAGRSKAHELWGEEQPAQPPSHDIRLGFLWQRVPHITVRSIAQNPDIDPSMSRDAAEKAIARHAEYDVLFDRPLEDSKTVRVAGPFTVESLTPHRSLSFDERSVTRSETEAATEPDASTFEQSILENLAKAGVQNGRRQERMGFSSFETYAGEYIQAIGRRDDESDGAGPSRIAIAIGPQYGTVGASYVKNAAREAMSAEGVELLAILGFAFDPQVTGLTKGDVTVDASDESFASLAGVRRLGRLPVLMVRMNVDLLMGEQLKKTGAGNLFTVFGKPDIAVRDTEGGWVVEIQGVDVYDPTTGDVRSGGVDQVALWMIDTDYNGESFFVRHAYFSGSDESHEDLQRALRAEIEAEEWETLRRAVSRPFPRPETGSIAVKVINRFGDEATTVITIP